MRVVIAEDLVLLRAGLHSLLCEEGFEVVAAVGDGPALVSAVRALRPDLALVDVRMPPTHTDEGVRAALAARQAVPGTAVVILSQYVEERYATELLSCGEGVGYLLKDRVSAVEEFRDALLRVAAGGTALDPEVVAQLLGRRPGGGSGTPPGPLDRLSEREREVLSLMAEGRTNTAIAHALFVTGSAVEKHVAAIFGKLRLPSAASGHHRRVLAVLAHLGRMPEPQSAAPVNGGVR